MTTPPNEGLVRTGMGSWSLAYLTAEERQWLEDQAAWLNEETHRKPDGGRYVDK